MASIFGNTIIQNLEEKSSLDTNIQDIIDKSYNVDLNAFYRAIVANNKDPLRLGRIQVRIPSIHGTVISETKTPTEALPWAAPGIWNCAGNDMGQYLVPEVGTLVFVTFEQGDQTKPIYFGGISNQIGSTIKYIVNPSNINKGESYSVETNDYPEDLKSLHDKLLFKSAKGNEVIASDLDGKESMYLVDASGQSIEMENFGPYLKRRGTDLGYSGKPRMKLSTNRGSDVVLTNESEIMTTRQLQGQLDDIKILNKTEDLNNINNQLDKLLRDKFKDFGNYKYNKFDKVFNLDLKLNDILGLTTTTDKVYNYPIKIFNEFELFPGLFLQFSLVERDSYMAKALLKYRNTTYRAIDLDGAFIVFFAKPGDINSYLVTTETEDNVNLMANSEGEFYVYVWGSDIYDCTETWGFDYRTEFRFIVDTLQIPNNNTFVLEFDHSIRDFTGYISEIDWGDGNVDTYEEAHYRYSHTYDKVNSYLVRVKANDLEFSLPYGNEGTIINSRGIVSIESPIPICKTLEDNLYLPSIKGYGRDGEDSTLVHINKYLFRNYLLKEDSIDLSGVFKLCTNLKEIPFNLLEGFNSIKGLASTFEWCNKIKNIPEDLLEDKDLTECTDLSYMFSGCTSLELLPDYLFDNETLLNVETVEGMFLGSGLLKVPQVLLQRMENLTNINSLFNECMDLSYIPEDLLKYNKELITASYTFSRCEKIEKLPRYLFRYTPKLESLQMCFHKCTGIKEIYSDMFSNLENLENLYGTFWGSGLERIIRGNSRLISGIKTKVKHLSLSHTFFDCRKLSINAEDLLIYNVDTILPEEITISWFLYRDSFTGTEASTLPELWNIPNFVIHEETFGGTGNNEESITNYGEIPDGWIE